MRSHYMFLEMIITRIVVYNNKDKSCGIRPTSISVGTTMMTSKSSIANRI